MITWFSTCNISEYCRQDDTNELLKLMSCHEKKFLFGGYEQHRSKSASDTTQSDKHLRYLPIYSAISNKFVCGHRSPRSGCADAQTYLGPRCLHMSWRHIFPWRCMFSSRVAQQMFVYDCKCHWNACNMQDTIKLKMTVAGTEVFSNLIV